jgi:hypothetical protein
MSPLIYKLLHILGLVMAFMGLGALVMMAVDGATPGKRGRALAGAFHGIGLLLLLVSGFGMIAKYGYGFPLWVWAKIVIWLLFGALLVVVRRAPQHAAALWVGLPVLAAIAAWLALFKPGMGG